MVQSMKSIERHFNRWYNYPYVFLNDGDFNQTFMDTVKNYTSATVEFGKVGPEMWGYPDWIDPKVAKEGVNKQGDNAIMYGGMESYHFMCRFYSGCVCSSGDRVVELMLTGVAFSTSTSSWPSTSGTGVWSRRSSTSAISLSKTAPLPLDCVSYSTDLIPFSDPFLRMIEQNKTYGFTIAVKELRETVPNIFRYAAAYKRLNNIESQGLWEMFTEPKPEKKESPKPDTPKPARLPDVDPEGMEGEEYNMCHFWSNFEIARLDFFRSKEYEDFFQMMDRSGGFWMERVCSPLSCPGNLRKEKKKKTDHPLVGRRTHPLPRSRRPPRPPRHPLLPRLRLPPHHHPALSRQRTHTPTTAPAFPRKDDAQRARAPRGGRVLGVVGRAQGEWGGLSLPV